VSPDNLDEDDFIEGFEIDPRELNENPTVDHNIKDKAVKIYTNSQFMTPKDDIQLIPLRMETSAGAETIDTKLGILQSNEPVDPTKIESLPESSELPLLDLKSIIEFVEKAQS